MKKRQPISLGRFPWIADTVFQLATNSSPPVSVQFREEILAEKVKPELREQADHYPTRLALLREQHADGTFLQNGKCGPEQDPCFNVCLKLFQLHDLGVRKEDEGVKKAFDYLAKAQRTDGSFPPNIHHTAFISWVYAIYGLGKAPAAKKAVKFLERTRRRDSGWLDSALEPTLEDDEDSPSCAWTTLHAVLALSELAEQRRSMEVRRATVFLLDRFSKRNHASFFSHPDHWRELDYGYEGTLCFKWAIPKMLLILGRLGCGPETREVGDLIEFLRKTLRPDGRWGSGPPFPSGRRTSGFRAGNRRTGAPWRSPLATTSPPLPFWRRCGRRILSSDGISAWWDSAIWRSIPAARRPSARGMWTPTTWGGRPPRNSFTGCATRTPRRGSSS